MNVNLVQIKNLVKTKHNKRSCEPYKVKHEKTQVQTYIHAEKHEQICFPPLNLYEHKDRCASWSQACLKPQNSPTQTKMVPCCRPLQAHLQLHNMSLSCPQSSLVCHFHLQRFKLSSCWESRLINEAELTFVFSFLCCIFSC